MEMWGLHNNGEKSMSRLHETIRISQNGTNGPRIIRECVRMAFKSVGIDSNVVFCVYFRPS